MFLGQEMQLSSFFEMAQATFETAVARFCHFKRRRIGLFIFVQKKKEKVACGNAGIASAIRRLLNLLCIFANTCIPTPNTSLSPLPLSPPHHTFASSISSVTPPPRRRHYVRMSEPFEVLLIGTWYTDTLKTPVLNSCGGDCAYHCASRRITAYHCVSLRITAQSCVKDENVSDLSDLRIITNVTTATTATARA